jgi:hypothetical protein
MNCAGNVADLQLVMHGHCQLCNRVSRAVPYDSGSKHHSGFGSHQLHQPVLIAITDGPIHSRDWPGQHRYIVRMSFECFQKVTRGTAFENPALLPGSSALRTA